MSKKINYRIGIAVLILVAIYFALDGIEKNKNLESTQNNQIQQDVRGLAIIEHAYKNKLESIQVQSVGTVKVLLPDDNKGSRHQKFILELDNGQTVLVAHNIDLAPRIPNLSRGDRVDFYGEYEYSSKGGVIHWTHHDSKGSHIDGWLKHNNLIYK
ncbi:DUF3465 domain-containing protein [Acinetobacter equi]|uniref:DUF3465 domain-containing protein n=1 Tax=Acinetobacter equi TaxID=1324350 RepID=A0A0N9W1W7_9GAMM|nr:DUF3465 domain-containing protein [Acinetobacter equi]ALH95646.1 hypothetical protein AOY20_08955 [Acinetobacter equi]